MMCGEGVDDLGDGAGDGVGVGGFGRCGCCGDCGAGGKEKNHLNIYQFNYYYQLLNTTTKHTIKKFIFKTATITTTAIRHHHNHHNHND